MIAIILSFSFDAFAIVMIFRRGFTNEPPSAQTIFGALCIDLLVGFSFTSV